MCEEGARLRKRLPQVAPTGGPVRPFSWLPAGLRGRAESPLGRWSWEVLETIVEGEPGEWASKLRSSKVSSNPCPEDPSWRTTGTTVRWNKLSKLLSVRSLLFGHSGRKKTKEVFFFFFFNQTRFLKSFRKKKKLQSIQNLVQQKAK